MRLFINQIWAHAVKWSKWKLYNLEPPHAADLISLFISMKTYASVHTHQFEIDHKVNGQYNSRTMERTGCAYFALSCRTMSLFAIFWFCFINIAMALMMRS